MRRFFTTLNLKVCGLFVHPLTPFISETEYKRLISVKKLSLIWFFNISVKCFQWKKRLFVIGWASESFFTCSQKPRTMSEFVVQCNYSGLLLRYKNFPRRFCSGQLQYWGWEKDTEFGGLIIKGLVQNKLGFCSYTDKQIKK